MIRDANSGNRIFHHKEKDNYSKKFKRLEDLLFETMKNCNKNFDINSQEKNGDDGIISAKNTNPEKYNHIFNNEKIVDSKNNSNKEKINQSNIQNENDQSKIENDSLTENEQSNILNLKNERFIELTDLLETDNQQLKEISENISNTNCIIDMLRDITDPIINNNQIKNDESFSNQNVGFY